MLFVDIINYIRDIIITILFIVVLSMSFVIFYPILLLLSFAVSQRKFSRITEILAVNILLKPLTYIGYWNIEIIDKRRIKTFNNRYIIVANHVSFIDTLLVWYAIPMEKKGIMAKKYEKIPLLGRLSQYCGHITVDDKNPDTTRNALVDTLKTMQDGSSLFIYPEGSRSSNPRKLLPFKTGAFRLSKQTDIPILPVAITGSYTALPKGGILHPSKISIIIGDPIFPDIFNKNTNENIRQEKFFIETKEFISSNI